MDEELVTLHYRMTPSPKEIVETVVSKSSSDPKKLGGIDNHIVTHFQNLASDLRGIGQNTESPKMTNRMKTTVLNFDKVTLELVKTTGSWQRYADARTSLNTIVRGNQVYEKAPNSLFWYPRRSGHHHYICHRRNHLGGEEKKKEMIRALNGKVGGIDVAVY